MKKKGSTLSVTLMVLGIVLFARNSSWLRLEESSRQKPRKVSNEKMIEFDSLKEMRLNPSTNSDWTQEAVEDSQFWKDCKGKERVIEVLLKVGVDIVNITCSELPRWEEIVALYGEEPVIYGLETCQVYRDSVKDRGHVTEAEVQPVITGLMNTGTNSMSMTLKYNYRFYQSHKSYNMGCISKHASLQLKQRAIELGVCSPDDIVGKFPIVMVRDPYRWMASMCQNPYRMTWNRGLNRRCPNLVPSTTERQLPQFSDRKTFEVMLPYPDAADPVKNETFASLIDMWSEWNRQYFDARFPRLVVRFEDILFHPDKVVTSILSCLGKPVPSQNISYTIERAKDKVSSSDFVTALMTYGREQGRYNALTENDFEFLKSHLDFDLMDRFHYKAVVNLSHA